MTRRTTIGGSVACAAVAAILFGASPASADDKEARGTTTAVSDSSVTVKAGGRDLTFVVDKDTRFETKAAAKKTRAARSVGEPGIKLTDFLQPGRAVIVLYREANGANQALSIRPVSDAGPGGGTTSDEAAKTANGTVRSISHDAVTIASGDDSLTFVIDSKTRVSAKGATAATKAAGGKLVITDVIAAGDRVAVTYSESNGRLNAADVRLVTKIR
jgi:hypothetical protein